MESRNSVKWMEESSRIGDRETLEQEIRGPSAK